MKILNKIFSNKKGLTLFTALFLAGFFGKIVFATPPSSPYAPGETLNPICGPTDLNCDVELSLTGANMALSNLASVAINTDLIGAVAGGMGIRGGTAANDDLILEGTTSATRATSYVNLQPNGGFVGIGTSSPAAKLDVSGGNIYMDNGYGIFVRDTGGVQQNVLSYTTVNNLQLFQRGATGGLQIGYTDASNTGAIQFYTGANTEVARITTSGFVGIGTTNPAAKLDVGAGNISLDNAHSILFRDTGGSQQNVLSYTTANNLQLFQRGATGAIQIGYTNASNAGAIQFYTGANTEVARITTSGNVGFGVTNPTAVLHLKAGTAAANTAPLKFNSGTLLATPEAGAVEFLADAFYGTITTGGARKQFAFTSDITGVNSGTNTGDNAPNTLYSGLAASKQDLLVSNTNIKTIGGISLLGSGDIAVGTGTVTAVSIATANGFSGSSSGGATPALTIIAGAITPTSVNGVSAATMAFLDATSSVQTQLNSKQATLVSGTNIKTINSVSILGSGDLVVSGADATKLPLAGGTMVGDILMTSNKIIGGSTTTSDLFLQTTSGVGTTGADMHFLVGNNGATEAVTISNNGNVGIGTASPVAKLDVVGGSLASTANALSVTGTLSSANAAQKGVNIDITPSGSATQAQQAMSATLEAGYTGSSYTMGAGVTNVSLGTGTGALTGPGGAANYGLYNQTAGAGSGDNVGVAGIAQSSTGKNVGVFGMANVGGTTNYGVVGLVSAGTNRIGVMATLATTASLTESAALMADNGAFASNIFTAKDNGTTVFNIIDGGNVGIGTTTPGYKLEVAGGSDTASLRVTGTNTGTNWAGRIVAGGATSVFLMGQYNNQAWLGAHNAALNAWADFYINPDGGAKVFIGDSGGAPATPVPIITADNTTGNVGIGTATPAGLLHVSSDTAATGQTYLTQANASNDSFDLNFRKARGTGASPTVITTADELGVINFTGYGGAAGYITGAAIKGISSGTIADSRVPGQLSFWTGTNAAPSVLTERM
ncbi:MAG TPA: hypothetical protein VK675_04285, partial [Candidatus Paceibacterota bacterium]|nr:hypothetical protein [Candidatus Paceibacterota bacterium]